MEPLEISNRQARALLLSAQGLGAAPAGRPDLPAVVERLGVLQLDTINVVARAHHHILWSRSQSYRPRMLDRLYRERRVFEHFTHDASILPMSILPTWRRQFRRMRAALDRSNWWAATPGEKARAAMRARIEAEGPLSLRDFGEGAPRAGKAAKEMWSRSPHKMALDYMWYAGELATCHRRGFEKVYDLSERIFPPHWREEEASEEAQVDGLFRGALDRVGFGTLGELRRFWDAADAREASAWAASADAVPLRVEAADGRRYAALGPPDVEERLDAAAPSSRLRILNPFDPVVRDRARLERLFGFSYRNEMFVPREKRVWGYYVFPLLERDRFVGRLEARAERGRNALAVLNLWPEPGIRWTSARQGRLEAELARLARFAGLGAVEWAAAPPG